MVVFAEKTLIACREPGPKPHCRGSLQIQHTPLPPVPADGGRRAVEEGLQHA